MQQLPEILKSKKLKVTPQRISIYKILSESKEHLSAEHIYSLLQEIHPTISLATIYKTLGTFTKANLIQEINVGENSFRYDANCEPHPHFVCTKCKNIYDLPCVPSISTLKTELEDSMNSNILYEKIYVYGLCPHCKEEH